MTEPKPAGGERALDPELAPLQASFERGDFASLSEQLERLPEGRRSAKDAQRLANAIAVDPAHVVVLAACVLALIAITLQYAG